MRKLKFLLTIVFAATFFAGCVNTQLPEDFKVEPNPLEVHGQTVDVKISGTIPEKSFHKKAVVEITPVLRYDNQEKQLKSITLKGEKAEGEGQVISTKEGGKIEYSDTFEWDPDMKASSLYLTATLQRGDDSEPMPEIEIAEGVIMTSKRVAKTGNVSIAGHGYEKETIVKRTGNIYYEYNRSVLDWNLHLNEDNEEEIDSLRAFMKRGWEIQKINIDAWASPEGELSLNEELSEDRADRAEEWVVNYYEDLSRDDDNNINYEDVEEEITMNVDARGEDFDGFMTALEQSDLPNKKTIANVIKSQHDKTARERAIKDMTVIYAEIEDLLEVLRRAEITVYAYEPKRTEEEIAELSTTYPDSLSREELLYAATLTEDMETKLKIYKSAADLHPDNWRTHNNAAAILLELDREDEAATYLEQANALEPNNGHIANNMGVLAAWKEDYESATNYYSTASGKGIETTYNEGAIAIINGNYESALSAYSDVNCDYNKALAQLMTDKTNEATRTLDCAEETAQVHYLLAIIGARTNNSNMLYTNLKKAINMDDKYKQEAKVDREFIDYFDKSEFKEIVN